MTLPAPGAASPIRGQATPLTGEIQVNSETSADQRRPDVATLDNGNFVVLWDRNGFENYAIKGQLFDSTGSPLGNEFLIHDTPGDFYFRNIAPRADGFPSGGFVVVWHSDPKSGPVEPGDIFARTMVP